MEQHHQNANLHESLLFSRESIWIFTLVQCGERTSRSCCRHFFSPEPLIHTQYPSAVNKTESICEHFMTSLNLAVRLTKTGRASALDSSTESAGESSHSKCLGNVEEDESGDAVALGANFEPELPGRFPPDKPPLPPPPSHLPSPTSHEPSEIRRGLDKPANQSPSAISLGGTNAALQANQWWV